MKSEPKARVMPEFIKAPPEIIELFKNAVSQLPEVEVRQMFGYPCAFVNGNMLAGIFRDGIMLRLSAADRDRFLQIPGAKLFEPYPGRPMREYVDLPDGIKKSADEFMVWLMRGYEYVKAMPPKEKKVRKTNSIKAD